MKYIFINPVVDRMYVKEELEEVLLCNGYERVEVQTDWHGIVKEKYDEMLGQTKLTVLDTRCPKAIETTMPYLNKNKLLIPAIHPILIHCAMELAEREALKGHKKIITTPCESLANYGNNIKLQDTVFISWKEFLNQLDSSREIQAKSLDKSPIPLGYFKSLKAKVSSISGEENIKKHFNMNACDQDELIEMLYCHEGCHNGDGVLLHE